MKLNVRKKGTLIKGLPGNLGYKGLNNYWEVHGRMA